MPVIEGTDTLKVAEGEYDFAVDGGAVSTITLRSPAGASLGNTIPAGSVIMGGYVDVLTGFTTAASGQMALQSGESAADLLSAAVVSGAPYSTTGRKSLTAANFTGAASLKTTVTRSLQAVISVGAITAGKLQISVFYR